MVEGYRIQRDLGDEDLSLPKLFIVVRSLALAGRASARPELGIDDYQALLTDKACRAKL